MDLPWFSVAKPAWINIAPEKSTTLLLALGRLKVKSSQLGLLHPLIDPLLS